MLAERELRSLGLIERSSSVQRIRPSRRGKLHVQDPTRTWEEICAIEVDEEESRLIQAVNARSPRVMPSHATVEPVPYEELGVPDVDTLSIIIGQLERDYYLVAGARSMGDKTVRSTYSGLVWETRRCMLGISRWVDQLVEEWETTTVDFKRELELRTADQKAEFVKDVLGLVNTKASGPRWMIIGFDDKTRRYWDKPDRKLSEECLQQLINRYTDPIVHVRYKVVDYREGPVGTLEMIREPEKLPYRAGKTVGHEKRRQIGDVFVCHGSLTEVPSPRELAALEEEGRRARGAQH